MAALPPVYAKTGSSKTPIPALRLPKPHISVLFDCSGDEGLCMRKFKVSVSLHKPIDFTFKAGTDLIVGDDFPVLLVPISSPKLHIVFEALYEDPDVNPRGTNSKMFFNKEHITPSNTYGYCPHLTLAWFDKEADLEPLRAWVKAGNCPPPPKGAFALSVFKFKQLERSKYK